MAENNISKKNYVIRNVISNLLYQVVVIVMGLIIPRLYLENFGSEVNGLVSTVKQVFVYLMLLEAGVGLASQQALYKPIATDDKDKINGILSATKVHYNRTGFLYAALTMIFAIGYPFVISTNLPKSTCFLIVLFYGLPAVISFFVQGKYRILLEGTGKGYILTTFSTIMVLVNSILKILLLVFTNNLLLVQSLYCLEHILQMFLVIWYVKKHYPWVKLNVKPDIAAISQKNSVLLHQISGMIFNNTDAILISMFCGFKVVSVYMIYLMFFQYIDTFITAISTSYTYKLGQIYQTEKEKFKRYFDAYEAVFITAIFIVFTLMATFLLPIIGLYTKGITDIDYYNPMLLVLFAVMKLLTNSKIPCNDVLNFEGVFEKTRHHAVIEAVLNVTVSVVAINLWGIIGGIIGTIAALLYRGNMMIYYANKKILSRSLIKTYRKYIVNFTLFIIILIVLGVSSGASTSFVGVVLKCIMHALWVAPLYIIVNLIIEKETIATIKELGRSIRK